MTWSDLHRRWAGWQHLLARNARLFESRTRRERVILILGAAALIWAAMDALWLGDLIQQHQQRSADRLRDAMQQQAALAESASLTQELRQLELSQTQEIQAARQRAAAAQQRLEAGTSGLVSAADMLPLLQQLLSTPACAPGCPTRLRVRSMRSLSQAELSGTTAAGPAAASAPAAVEPALPGLWRHGVELVIEGSYADLVAYLERLEALPQRLLLGGLSFTVERHPRAAMTLRLYTLSLDQGWLEI